MSEEKGGRHFLNKLISCVETYDKRMGRRVDSQAAQTKSNSNPKYLGYLNYLLPNLPT